MPPACPFLPTLSCCTSPSELTSTWLVVDTDKERDGQACLAGAPCASNAVHVVLNGEGEAVVDNNLDIGDVQTTGSNICTTRQVRCVQSLGKCHQHSGEAVQCS
jgi:hypothetical protein